MKALLTGGSGFVGKHVEQYLRKHTKWQISLLDTIDLFDKYPIANLGEFDYIIHLASASSVEESINEPQLFISENIQSMLQILEYAREHPPKVFLHMSTVEVYNVTNPYAASKAAQEEIANAYWKTYGVPVVIARSSNIIGQGQAPDKFIPKIIDQVKHGRTVSIYTSNGEQGSRVYNPVVNVADAILFLLQEYPAWAKDKTDFPAHYDIDGGVELTNQQMAELVAAQLGKELHYKLIEPKAMRPAYARYLVQTGTKLSSMGWKPPQGQEELLAWVR